MNSETCSMMPSDMPDRPVTTCERFDAEVRRFVSTAVGRPMEVEIGTSVMVNESEHVPVRPVAADRPWHAEAA
jgi:hypothetical protein